MSDHHSAAATEDDSLTSPGPSSGADVENALLSPPRAEGPASLPLSAFFPLLIMLGGAVLSLIGTVALILNAQKGYEIDYLHVSSFNVFTNSSLTTWEWDATLSVNRSRFFDDRDVAYEARSWLYSRNGFISVSSPSMSPELILRSNFTMKEVDEEAVAGDGILIIDLLIEVNATRGGTAPPMYLMIECSDLEIEFTVNRSNGALSGAAKKCGVEVYATKADALQSSRILDLLRRLFYYFAFRKDPGMSRVY